MSSAVSIDRSRKWGVPVVKFIEWAVVTYVAAVLVVFAVGFFTGPTIDFDAHHNQVLVWSAVAGGIALSASHGWIVHNRDVYGGVWSIPGSAAVAWTLATGAVLGMAAVVVDRSRLDRSSFEYGELVLREPIHWGMWVPLVIVASVSLLYARRLGVMRLALASLPLQVLWWSATLITST